MKPELSRQQHTVQETTKVNGENDSKNTRENAESEDMVRYAGSSLVTKRAPPSLTPLPCVSGQSRLGLELEGELQTGQDSKGQLDLDIIKAEVTPAQHQPFLPDILPLVEQAVELPSVGFMFM
ncbi:hypothetical protein FDECE_1485 [Fusarium decemcellulare]|nr:hypothetical protein FDECE_1485 [Fusarium decemcellulare]